MGKVLSINCLAQTPKQSPHTRFPGFQFFLTSSTLKCKIKHLVGFACKQMCVNFPIALFCLFLPLQCVCVRDRTDGISDSSRVGEIVCVLRVDRDKYVWCVWCAEG